MIHRQSSIQIFEKESTMNTLSCPECIADIQLESGTVIGEIIVCSDCGVDLEVMSLTPPTIDLAPMEEEDWGE